MTVLNDEGRRLLRWLDAMEEVPVIGRQDPSRPLAESLAEAGWLRRVQVRRREPDGAFVLSGAAVSAIGSAPSAAKVNGR